MSALDRTRNGGIPIGVRRGWGAWQRDLPSYLGWVKAHGFAHVDLGNDADTVLADVVASGVKVGSVDLPRWKELLSPDSGRRADAIAEAGAYAQRCLRWGVNRFLVIMLPEDPARSRAENFTHMIASYGALLPVFERANAAIVIEGWPGPGALCSTPETLRALFRELPSKAIGINFDPSHLVRMGIEVARFVDEFAPRIRHAHAKDTALLPDRAYELGTETPPTFFVPARYSGNHWRYTIPGKGVIRWPALLAQLHASGFRGRMSIELEDEDYNGTDTGEQNGILAARDFLAQCQEAGGSA